MSKPISKRARWTIPLVGLIVFAIVQFSPLQRFDPWLRAEGMLVDLRFRLRGPLPARPDVKLIGIQNSSFELDALSPREISASPTLQLMKQPWPWDRRVYAATLEKLMQAGAKVVVFDFVFANEAPGDADFAGVLEKYKNRVVVASTVDKAERKYTPPNQKLLPAGDSDVVGVATFWPDVDEVVRRASYQFSWEREVFNQVDWMDNDVRHLSALAVQKFNRGTVPPREGFIDFQGAQGTYTPLPLEYLFVPKLWAAPPINSGSIFSNTIVVIGPVATIFHDIHNTPFGQMSGPELQAQMIAGLLNGACLHSLSAGAEAGLTLVAVLLALALCMGIENALLQAVSLLATTFIFVVSCQLAFDREMVVTMMPPLAGLIGTGLLGGLFHFQSEQFERRRYRGVLERYVSKNVAQTILEDPRPFVDSLNGGKKSVTVMFCDIRGFTAMSEGNPPEDLIAQLNEYFYDMVEVVLHEGGTLQKFVGDAILAAWGDTHTTGAQADAVRAVRAALRMRQVVQELNRRWTAVPGRNQLTIGIGVNHGEVIVGNVGHPLRMEFTVLGDGVNLASRLEAATKLFHTDILVGENVFNLTKDDFVYRVVDVIKVKGRTQPVEVFALLSDNHQPPPPWLAAYHHGVQLYRGRHFAEALEQFEHVARQIDEVDFLSRMYIRLCESFLENPPPETWTGSPIAV